MEKLSEIRNALKWNFLKSIIVRLDYTNVSDSSINKTIEELKDFFVERGFNRCIEKTNNNVEVNLPNQGNDFRTELKDKYKVLCFINDESGFSIELSRKSIVIIINSSNYIRFSVIADIYLKMVNTLSNVEKLIVYKRLGIRKINVILFNSFDVAKEALSCSNVFFSSVYGNCLPLLSSFTDRFICNNYGIIVNKKLENGKINESNWLKCTLDFDVSIDEKMIATDYKKVMNRENIYEMDDLIYNLYINSLNDSFVSQLTNDFFSNDCIIGVEPNE